MSFPVVCRLRCPLPGDNQLLHQLPHLLLGKSQHLHITWQLCIIIKLYRHNIIIQCNFNIFITRLEASSATVCSAAWAWMPPTLATTLPCPPPQSHRPSSEVHGWMDSQTFKFKEWSPIQFWIHRILNRGCALLLLVGRNIGQIYRWHRLYSFPIKTI